MRSITRRALELSTSLTLTMAAMKESVMFTIPSLLAKDAIDVAVNMSPPVETLIKSDFGFLRKYPKAMQLRNLTAIMHFSLNLLDSIRIWLS